MSTATATARSFGSSKRESRKRPHPIAAMKAHKAVIGRVLVLLLLLAACLVPVLFVNNAISYIPLISAVLAVAASYAYLRVLMRSLSFSEASMLPSCERGSEIEFVVDFKNSSPLVFTRIEPFFYISDLFGDMDVSIPATMTLMPHEERDFRFQASFDHIGTYSAGVEKIVIGDLLGLFSHTIVNPHRHEVQVLPRLFDVRSMDLSNVSVQESRKAYQPIVTDDMDYAGVREYVPGDPIKTIHWKLSSRNTEGQYFTRLFETFGNPGISIILDTKAPGYDHEGLMQVFDGVVESALSINDFAYTQGIDAELVFNDKFGSAAKMRVRGVESADSVSAAVPRIEVAGAQEGTELLRREGFSIHAQGNIAYCTAHLDERIISTLLDIKLHKHNPLLFLVVPSALEGRQKEEFLRPLRRLSAGGVSYKVVCSADDLSGEGRA